MNSHYLWEKPKCLESNRTFYDKQSNSKCIFASKLNVGDFLKFFGPNNKEAVREVVKISVFVSVGCPFIILTEQRNEVSQYEYLRIYFKNIKNNEVCDMNYTYGSGNTFDHIFLHANKRRNKCLKN